MSQFENMLSSLLGITIIHVRPLLMGFAEASSFQKFELSLKILYFKIDCFSRLFWVKIMYILTHLFAI